MKTFRIVLVLITILSIITGIAVFLLTGGMQHDVSTLVALGEKYLEEGDYEQASLQFERAIAIAEKSPEAWYGTARASIGLGNDADAIAALKTVAELDSSQKDKIAWMIEKIEAGEGMDLIPLTFEDAIPTPVETSETVTQEPLDISPSDGDVMSIYGSGYQSVKEAYLDCLDDVYTDPVYTARIAKPEEEYYMLTDLNGDNQPELLHYYYGCDNYIYDAIKIYLYTGDVLKEFGYAGGVGYVFRGCNHDNHQLALYKTKNPEYQTDVYRVELDKMLHVAEYVDVLEQSFTIYGENNTVVASFNRDDYEEFGDYNLDIVTQTSQIFNDDQIITDNIKQWLTKEEVIAAINAM